MIIMKWMYTYDNMINMFFFLIERLIWTFSFHIEGVQCKQIFVKTNIGKIIRSMKIWTLVSGKKYLKKLFSVILLGFNKKLDLNHNKNWSWRRRLLCFFVCFHILVYFLDLGLSCGEKYSSKSNRKSELTFCAMKNCSRNK
jgi:hypothetical protein